MDTLMHMQKRRFPPMVLPLDSGSCIRGEAVPSHATHADTPTQSNLIHTGA